MSDELDAITEQAQVDEAAGAVHFWRGKRLHFAYEHNTAFERLGVFGRGVTSNLEAAASIVYLGLLDDAGVERMDNARDQISVKALRKEIAKWANEQGLTMNNAEGIECSRIADEIWTATRISRFAPVIPDAEKKREAPDSARPTLPITSPQFPPLPTAA